MTRLHPMRGLALLTAASLLAGCSAIGPAASQAPDAAAAPQAAKRMLRLANYERGGKVDIVTNPNAEPWEARRRLSPQDQIAKVAALWHAINGGAIGQPITWSNGDTGSHGYAEIMREVPIPESDRVCREYREAFVVDGRGDGDVGQACQLRDGSWWKIQG